MTSTRLIDKEILRLSIPAVVSNVTVPLLGLCDTAIAGHLGSELYLAAIAVGSMMLNTVFWLFGFLRMGTTGLAANAYGAGDSDGQRLVFGRAVALAVMSGVILILLRSPLSALLMWLVGADPQVTGLAERYFGLCLFEAPALLGIMAVSGWFVGMQSTVWPMIIAIGVNVLNIVLSLVLVFGLKLGFIGTAWGTLTANWAGFIFALVAAWRYDRSGMLWCGWRRLFNGGILRFFRVSGNLFLRSFFLTAVMLGVAAAGARMGALTLAVNAVLMQFFTLFSFFMDGFAFSAEALVGRWAGAKDAGMLRLSVRRLLIWSVCVAVVFGLAYTAFGNALVSLLTDESSVRDGAAGMMTFMHFLPLVAMGAFIYDGFYIGVTDTGRMLLATFCASVLFFAVTFGLPAMNIHISGLTPNQSLWMAFLGYLAVRGLVLAVLWPRIENKICYDKIR